MFGLAGAHRSGKSTLARAISDTLGIPYFEASFSKYAKQLGVDAVSDLPLDQRVQVQQACLDLYCEELKKQPMTFITDRTPVDMLGYMIAEIGMHSTSAEIGQVVKDYADRCLHETSRHFDTVIVTQPLPDFIVDPKSPAPNLAYQWHIHWLIHGAVQQIRNHVTEWHLRTSDFNQRLNACLGLITSRMEKMKEEQVAGHLH